MKNFTLLLNLFLCCIFCIHASISLSQSAGTKWITNPYEEKVFVENNGQFASLESELGCKILFSFEQGNTTFFLCNDQFIVREAKEVVEGETQEKDDPATEHFPAPSFSYLKFSLGKASVSSIITGEKKSQAIQKYHAPDASGQNKVITASAFSQVLYKNFYDGIDLIFSAHEKNGIKYQYIVHPFANASLIHTNYTGVGNIELDSAGNLHAGIRGTEILDHAPKTFYADDNHIIPSSYALRENSYSILTSNYDPGKTIIIDPWVVNPNFVNQNKAFDIAGDAAGNVYVFGGHFPWKVKKFNTNGNPVWTFNTSFNAWYGALAVDPSGNSIITEGCCGGRIVKLDSAGNVAWSLTNGVDEYWRLAYSCDFSSLYLATGNASTPGLQFESISRLDTATGAITNSTAFFGAPSEPRSLAAGLDGNIYTISCGGGVGADEVLVMTPSFTTLFSVSSGYNLLYNGPLYANGSNTTSGQNGISGGNNFFCTSNGATLYKRNNTNGAMISSITIPGGNAENNSGILVDSCDNIYVGSSDAVIKYDSSLNIISTTPTSGAVYCLSPGLNGELLVSGNGFIASMDLSVCRDIFCNSNPNQGSNIVSASDTQLCEKFCINFFDSSPNNPIAWQWSFPGGSPSSSTDQNPENVCYDFPGSYDVTVITTSANGNDTLILPNYITVYATPPFPTITQVGYTLTSSSANSYQWQLNTVDIPGATNQSYTVTQSGLYTVIVGDSNGCKNSESKYVVISGTDDVNRDGNILIFPNPASDEISIQASSIRSNEVTTISIINVLGKIAQEEIVSWKEYTTLDIKNLPTGVYLIIIGNENEKNASLFVKE